MPDDDDTVARYFAAIGAALAGLDTFLHDEKSGAGRHDLIAGIAVSYLKRLRKSLDCWENRIRFADKFRISRAESGFPAYENVLALENDRRTAEERIAALSDEATIREEMVDFILRKKALPSALQATMAERRYLQTVKDGGQFASFMLPSTVRVSVNPKTKRPYYVVHWGYFDGTEHLPIVYLASIEDSSKNLKNMLVGKDGKLNKNINIPFPVEGLLNPELAHQFDQFAEKNSAYGLTLSTIATNLDQDFEHLHPKQLRRIVLGPFYHAGTTTHGNRVEQVLANVRDDRHAWLMTWTLQEIFSMNERPAKRSFWSSNPARDEFYINTDNLECARQGVSNFERNALVPHEAYQAIYAAGELGTVFEGYATHVISGNQVLRDF